jgi:hypothetical protein
VHRTCLPISLFSLIKTISSCSTNLLRPLHDRGLGITISPTLLPVPNEKNCTVEQFHSSGDVTIIIARSSSSLTCFADPVHVAVHLPFQLLLFLEKEKSGSAFHAIFFFGKLSRIVVDGGSKTLRGRRSQQQRVRITKTFQSTGY